MAYFSRRSIFAAAFAFISATALFAETPPAIAKSVPMGAAIPIEAFFADSEMRSVQVSPDGRHIAFLAPLGTGRVGIALMDTATGKTEPLVGGTDESYASFFWKTSDLIVYSGDVGGAESPAIRSISIKTRRILPLAQAYDQRSAVPANVASIEDRLKLDPDHMLVFGVKDYGNFQQGFFMMNVTTALRTKQPGGEDKGTASVTADNTGAIRGRNRLIGKTIIHELRASPKDPFYKVGETNDEVSIAAPMWEFLHFNADNKTLYAVTRFPNEPVRLRAYDTTTRSFVPGIDYNLEGDLDSLVLSWDYSRLLGVYYMTDRLQIHWFDPTRAALQAKIDSALPGTINRIISQTQDEQICTIAAVSDREPAAYYVLNLQNAAKGRPALMFFGRANSKLVPDQLQPMQSISYPSRDGLTIHGYLTLPAGAKGKRVPLIIHPHGGPYGIRDEWGFDPEVQFLASRGYAVLQPNYRGSSGYGASFMLAGRHEWGGRMQDDLSDGVKWAIDQGIADPARVAIVGASYGGYAALAGVTLTPELYCCAVNYVGVSDLSIITSHGRNSGSVRIFQEKWIGDDKEYLYNRSPVNFVQNIRVPTLHAYGDNDPRVDIDNWKRLKSKLDEYHKPYEFVREADQGHGFSHEDARINFYRQVDTFLAKYLRSIPEGKVDIKETKVLAMPAKSDN